MRNYLTNVTVLRDEKHKKESYIVNADSLLSAEMTTCLNLAGSNIERVTAVVEKDITKVFPDALGGWWYEVKISVFIDEQVIKETYYQQALSTGDAEKEILKKVTGIDLEITGTVKKNILDYFIQETV